MRGHELADMDLDDPNDILFDVPWSDEREAGQQKAQDTVQGVALYMYFPERGGIVLDADGGYIKLHFSESEKARLLASQLPRMTGQPILAVFTLAPYNLAEPLDDEPSRFDQPGEPD